MKYQIIVAGGGFTGVAAAVAAAREGAKVLLIEKSSFLGGAATNMLVNPFMRYSWYDEEKGHDNINRGIFITIKERLEEIGAMLPDRMTFSEEYLKIVMERLCMESGVKILYHSMITGTESKNGRVEKIFVTNKSGATAFGADYFIDCTGDADIAALSNFPYRVGRDEDSLCQPMTLCFRLNNVDIEKFKETRSSITPLYAKFREEGKITNPRENVLVFHTVNKGILHFNTTRIIKKNPLNAFDLSEAEIMARGQILEMFKFLKENFEAFKDSELLYSAPEIGVRESRMIDGEYVLTGEDLLSCKIFDDSVACGCYEIDIHSPDGTGTHLVYLKKGTYYTIPYRSLIPLGSKNLLVAGRCLSATHEAQSAVRVMPIVACMGEGAGLAASIALKDKTDVKNVDIKKLHGLLDKYGARYN